MDKIKNLNITLALLYMIYLSFFSYFFLQVMPRHSAWGSGDVSPDGVQGQSPCINPQPNSFRPPSAASGAAQPPRPHGAGFRRKREPRGARERQKLVSSRVLKTSKKQRLLFYNELYYILQFIFILTVINTFPTPFTQDLTHNPNNRGFGGTCPPTGCRGRAPASIYHLPSL